MADQQPDEPKLVIDEDWKSQVQAEKDALAGKPASTDESPEPAPQTEASASSRPQIPAPTLPLLFTSLATQAMFALGVVPDPQTGKQETRLDEARHIIDTLQLLEDKTAGNRSPDESALLTRLLYDLRMQYVAARDAKK